METPFSHLGDPKKESSANASRTWAQVLELYHTVRQLLFKREFAHKTARGYTAGPIKKDADQVLGELRRLIQAEPGWLELNLEAASEMLENCVVVVDYFDDLQGPAYAWILPCTESYHAQINNSSHPPNRLLRYLQLAIVSLHVEHRRNSAEHRDLEQKFAQLEAHVKELLYSRNPEGFRVGRRYYDLRAQVARQSSARHGADRFIDLAFFCGDMEVRLQKAAADEIYSEKLISIGLTKVWLQISKGHYLHAQELLALIHSYIVSYSNDPLTYAKYLVAKNVCRRALAGKERSQLRQIIDELSVALKIFDQLGDRRHLLRCYHERSLCFLLLGDHNKVRDDLSFMEKFSKVDKSGPSVGWQIQYDIMRSRLACRDNDYKTAEEAVTGAMSLAINSQMDLLTIEAKNTLAMICFRQGQLARAEGHLEEALRLNHQGLRQTDHGDLSQPALYGVSLLYLARVALLRNDSLAALSKLQIWQRHRAAVEHQWVKNLADEIEARVFHQCLIEKVEPDTGKVNFERQLLLLRKVSIERASRIRGSKKIVDIAEELDVRRQTIHAWLKELQEQNIAVQI
jgi:tetratricopeptide (TPR) repeat protein